VSSAAGTLEVQRRDAPVSQSAAILARVGEARAALAEVETVEEAIRIAGFADSVRHAARQARAGIELENAAMEVKLRAERRAGGLLAAMSKNGGTRGQLAGRSASGGPRVEPPDTVAPTLADLGVSKRQSSTYQQVAAIPGDVFEAYVAAPNGRLSRNALLRDGKRAGQYAPVVPPPMPAGVWNVLLADPPWRYEPNSVPPSCAIEAHYPTLTLEEICALEVPAADDAVLFLWATAPKLPDALRVMNAWGFQYRTCAVWVKDRIGMGYYFRGRHELLLVGRRGDMPVPDGRSRPDSVIEAPRGRHSQKPAVIYDLLEAMYPSAARLELFARGSRPGWDRWGWDADGDGAADTARLRPLRGRSPGRPRLVTDRPGQQPVTDAEPAGLDFSVGFERVMCR
jgi:N6-adenosine-specific RNA methylase IME4